MVAEAKMTYAPHIQRKNGASQRNLVTG